MLSEMSLKHHFRLTTQSNSGVSHARNVGAALAQNEVILFTQGDIVANNSVLEIHAQFHDLHSHETYALVGNITWHSNITVTPFMRWLEHGGPQFDFDRLESGKIADHLSFYTPQVSLKKDFFKKSGGFDESFVVSEGVTAYEDTELAWRLTKLGMKLYYDSSARVFHFHRKTLESVLNRRYYEGMMSVALHNKHPDYTFGIGKQLSVNSLVSDSTRTRLSSLLLQPLIGTLLDKISRWCETRYYIPLLYKLTCRYSYNRGLNDAKRKNIH